jgi:NAD+ synthase
VVPNGSPYARDKNDLRLSIAVARVTESGLPLVYLNQIGGQDELVFDGASFALNADLSVAAQLPAFEENITTLRWTRDAAGWRCKGPVAPLLDGDKGDYAACVLGLRDYVRKNGFPGVLLGVSGGIDSALCAAIAVDALGAEKVRGVMLPFRFTAQVSLDDAAKLAKALGFPYEVLPIADAVNGFEKILSVPFAGLPRDITEENLQARTRGTLLMAISNKTGAMVVTTGNKSEMSVGYATIYGATNGSRTARSGLPVKSFRSTSSSGRRRRSCARTRPTRIRCRLTTCWTGFWNGWWSARSRWPRSSPPVSRPTS